LLAQYNAERVYTELEKILIELNALSVFQKIEGVRAYKDYSIDHYTLLVKHLNYLSDYILQENILNILFDRFHISSKSVWDAYYMNQEQIIELKNA
jgi:tRNA nucleotidyltransferase/poly(A) polymerase